MVDKDDLLDVTALVLQCLIDYVNSDEYEINETITYKELANRVNHRQVTCRTLGRHLGNIVELCKRLEVPILPVIVVSKTTGEPGEGFYEAIGLPKDATAEAKEQARKTELMKVRDKKDWDTLEMNFDFLTKITLN